MVDTKRDALHAAAARGAVVFAVCGGYQLLGHGYAMGGERLPGVGLVDLETVREDGPRLIGNVAIEGSTTAPRARRLREPRRPDAARAPATRRSGACSRATATTAAPATRACAAAPHGTVIGHLSPRSAAPQERPLRRLADRHRAGRSSWRRSTTRSRTPRTPPPAGPPGSEPASDQGAAPRSRGLLLTTSQHRPDRGAVGLPAGGLAGVPGGDEALSRQRPRRPSTTSRSRSGRARSACSSAPRAAARRPPCGWSTG